MRWRLLRLDFPYLVGELLIVVIGVSIALAADQWRQARIDNDLSEQYVSRLIEELQTDIRGWERLDRSLVAKIEALNRSLELLDRPLNNEESITEYLTSLSVGAVLAYGSGTETVHVTFDELVSSGRLDLIRDIETRTSLLTYYSRAEVERNRVTFRITNYAPTVYELIPRGDQDFRVLEDLTYDQKVEIVKRTQVRDLESLIIAERNFAQEMTRVVANLMVLSNDLKQLLEKG